MAFLLNQKTASALRLNSQLKSGDPISFSRRGFHVEPGPREKALLAPNPSLKRFKSPKETVRRIKKVGDVLTIVVVAGCCYEIYVRASSKKSKESV